MLSKLYTCLIIGLLLVCTFALRWPTFYLPHNHGDQIHYLALAKKLDEEGLKGYNLKWINVVNYGPYIAILSSKTKKGTLLQSLESKKTYYYSRETLSNMPPAYSFLLMLSHRLYASEKKYAMVAYNLAEKVISIHPVKFFQIQYYAVWINLFLSLVFVLLVFLIGKKLFNENTGLWAAILIVVHPLDILVSQRIWADELLVVFAALSVLFWWYAREKKNIILAFLSGLFIGLSVLAKQIGLVLFIIFPAMIIIKHFLVQDLPKKSLSRVFEPYTLTAVCVGICLCSFWFAKIFAHYGVLLYIPKEIVESGSWWFELLRARSRWGQLYYFVYLSPVCILFYFEVVRTFIRKLYSPQRILCILWFLVTVAVLIFIAGKEARYMLIAYPAIALMTGVSLERIRTSMPRMPWVGNGILIALFLFVGFWGIRLGFTHVFSNAPAFLTLY